MVMHIHMNKVRVLILLLGTLARHHQFVIKLTQLFAGMIDGLQCQNVAPFIAQLEKNTRVIQAMERTRIRCL